MKNNLKLHLIIVDSRKCPKKNLLKNPRQNIRTLLNIPLNRDLISLKKVSTLQLMMIVHLSVSVMGWNLLWKEVTKNLRQGKEEVEVREDIKSLINDFIFLLYYSYNLMMLTKRIVYAFCNNNLRKLKIHKLAKSIAASEHNKKVVLPLVDKPV